MEIENIDDLKTAIQGIIVKDYGDFKRKSVLYLNRFTETQGQLSEDSERKMNRLKWHIQFHPSGDIESTRQWTLNQLDTLAVGQGPHD